MVRPLVLHYLGYDADRGGIVSVVRALADVDRFDCVLGVNPGFIQDRDPPREVLVLPSVEGERIDLRNLLRTRRVAKAVRAWLNAGPERVFHGHSRAGLLVALWLARAGERRVLASVHCYGRRRWFYRWSARFLGRRLFWLSPAMKAYYGVGPAGSWEGCIPGCVPDAVRPARAASRAVGDILRLGGVGALERWKRWDLVVRAVGSLPETLRRRIRFSHVGSAGPSPDSRAYAGELRRLTADHGLESSVEWRGEVPSARPLLEEVDCLVIASRNEPFSAAMLEALACGTPVLAADSGGARDLIVPPRNGGLFRSGDSADLARALRELLETDALSRFHVEASDCLRFAAPAVAEEWRRVYAGLIGEE